VSAFPVRDAHPMTSDFASERGLRESEPPTDAGERFTIHKANVVSGNTAVKPSPRRRRSNRGESWVDDVTVEAWVDPEWDLAALLSGLLGSYLPAAVPASRPGRKRRW
jgi:hypothetical protein